MSFLPRELDTQPSLLVDIVDAAYSSSSTNERTEPWVSQNCTLPKTGGTYGQVDWTVLGGILALLKNLSHILRRIQDRVGPAVACSSIVACR